ncbi:HNH endonuclease signature motif containing protein [Mycolicibacterium aubagnense]|uniref:HNH endonuclease n=1 Tax=Mycolicibacterium aubagnense TaxID=319707 RepID=A0ABM7IK82_9MYCO|nr:HNH endonuclease signature motif containing protein [Mycolicibacterium aubagnense]TLH66330.1 HNH endonuclease [Mycolicibacterium aubagnense]BBX87145.1 HNH endonuclease [Mycolicibacterium aubagnense]
MGLTDPASVEQAYAAYEAAAAAIASLDYTGLDVRTLLELQSRRETLKCAAEAVDHQILAAAQTQATAKDIGAKDWPEVLHIRHRIGRDEARRRVRDCDHLGPRSAITGEPLGPVWALVAAALAEGAINIEHVAVITNFFAKVPLWVDPATLAQCERDLVSWARYKSPEDLRAAAKALLYRLDQDGPEPDDDERDRKRGITVSKQRSDGTSEVAGTLTPQARAYWDAIYEKYAAPSMCNPADPTPCTSGTPTAEQIAGDTRTVAQRQHDAQMWVARMALTSGMLGEHNGLPVSVVATTTLQELQQGAGVAVTHTGSKLSIRDVIRMASRSYCYLAVFDQHTNIPLYLGRTRRTATPGQRIMLFARDRGCTKPGCTAPASRCQAHHAVCNWRDDGQTDITDMTLACGCDNVLADTGGWTTTMKNGRAHWTPPPLLDVGQPRTNQYHHPTLYPAEGEDADGESDSPAS